MTRVERRVEIARPPAEVFAFVADPLNDPRWCPTVLSCERVSDTRYVARHRPTRMKPAAELQIEVTELDSPRRARLREEDDDGVFEVTYTLEPAGDGTRFTQVSEVEWKLPRLLATLGDRMVPRHLDGQMAALKRELEADDLGPA